MKPDLSAFGDRDNESATFVEELFAYEERASGGGWMPYKKPYMDAVRLTTV